MSIIRWLHISDLHLNTNETESIRMRRKLPQYILDNNIEYDARLAAEELAKRTRSEVVQVIGSKFVLYRETHSKPREKRIALVRDKRRPN